MVPGDTAWVEDPGYPGMRSVLRSRGAVVVARPVDHAGVTLPQEQSAAPKLIYTTPSHQFPTGVTMPLPRRLEERKVMKRPSASASLARRFLPIWALGLIGVLGLLLQAPPATLFEQAPQLRELPQAALRALLLVNPLLLVTVAALVGAAVTPRLLLRSRLAGDVGAQMAPGLALVVGLLLAAALAITDAALADSLGDEWREVLAEAKATPQLHTLVTGVLYGGLAEEVMMRWGLMSLIAWLLLAVQERFSGGSEQSSVAPMWTAIALAALVFAAGHLPALAQSVTLTGPLVIRTVFLNVIAGMAYGWLFWRKGFECAMLAHAFTHVGLTAARMLL